MADSEIPRSESSFRPLNQPTFIQFVDSHGHVHKPSAMPAASAIKQDFAVIDLYGNG